MGDGRRNQNKKSPARLILLILTLIFLGPFILSVGVTVFVTLGSIALGILVLALILLSSPIIFMVFPGAVGINLPAPALFFFGIAMLALFILVSAMIIQILRRFLMFILNFIKQLLGR